MRLKKGIIVALAASLALITLLVGWVGWREVVRGVAAIGLEGFVVFTLYWIVVMAITGLAWATVAPGASAGRTGLFIWGRLLREAAADVLPFSQVGGILVGARAVIAAGVAEEIALASTLVDLTVEIAAQAFYTLMGIGLILISLNGKMAADMLWPAAGGLAVLFVGVAAIVLGHGYAVGAIGKVAHRWMPNSVARADAITAQVAQIFRQPGRITWATVLHLLGWIGGGGASWIALRYMGAEVPFWAVIAVESLMYAVRNVGFALPGGLGVQEGAYVILGPLFGIHAGDALALSLLRRGRDVVIGLPVLLIWQAKEGRLALRRRRERRAEASVLEP